ncbi:MAG: TetR/AcrR family transcriptional regulator [Anaerolineales bacterium]|nr:TetR/AcrR family transcriptional regulator [Chloroflexota bacterium]MBL6980820.1 TetR/AcrR family transcriptional regulator [Anaerolineales bacterium]
MEQIDRRVRRTKKSLEEALIALALEKGYDAITIQEITDRADIGYRTFFRHYADKDELLKDVLSATLLELQDLMAPPPPELFMDPNFSATEFINISVLFKHVQENSNLYRVLLDSDRTIIQTVIAFAEKNIRSRFHLLRELDVPKDIIANHMISAPLALVRWWLDAGMPYSAEEMGEYAFRLVVLPIRDMVLEALPEQ